MKDRQQGWGELFRSLIEALVEVTSAELAVLREDWRRWGKHAMVIAALAAVVFSLVFCVFELLVVLGVVLFERWLGSWVLAVSATLAATLAFAAVLAWIAALVARRAGTPVAQARARWADHRRWWREQVLVDERSYAETTSDER